MKNAGNELEDADKEILKETEGIGTEATRANVIDTLKQQEYIVVKKNIVSVTSKGDIMCKAVEGTLLSSPEMTAKWEGYLKRIGKKEGNKETFIAKINSFVENLVKETSVDSLNIAANVEAIETDKHISKCPTCRVGFITDKIKFYGCTEYKNGCKQTFNKKILGKNITKKQIQDLCTKKKTNKIMGFKGKKEFDAYLVLDANGKVKFSFK